MHTPGRSMAMFMTSIFDFSVNMSFLSLFSEGLWQFHVAECMRACGIHAILKTSILREQRHYTVNCILQHTLQIAFQFFYKAFNECVKCEFYRRYITYYAHKMHHKQVALTQEYKYWLFYVSKSSEVGDLGSEWNGMHVAYHWFYMWIFPWQMGDTPSISMIYKTRLHRNPHLWVWAVVPPRAAI